MTAYDQGFIDRCAQAGISPSELAKRANMLGDFAHAVPAYFKGNAAQAQSSKINTARKLNDKSLDTAPVAKAPTAGAGRAQLLGA